MSTLGEPWMDELEWQFAAAARGATLRHRARRRTRSLGAVALVALPFAGSAALADSFNPVKAFQDLLGAQRERAPSDITPRVRAALQRMNHGGMPRLQVAQTRLLQVVPDAGRIYAVPTAGGNLCLFFSRGGMACGPRLGPDVPIRWLASSVSGQDTLVTGLARDDVRSVSITLGGRTTTVAVQNNTFWLRDRSGWKVPSKFVVELADGSSVAYPTGVPGP